MRKSSLKKNDRYCLSLGDAGFLQWLWQTPRYMLKTFGAPFGFNILFSFSIKRFQFLAQYKDWPQVESWLMSERFCFRGCGHRRQTKWPKGHCQGNSEPLGFLWNQKLTKSLGLFSTAICLCVYYIYSTYKDIYIYIYFYFNDLWTCLGPNSNSYLVFGGCEIWFFLIWGQTNAFSPLSWMTAGGSQPQSKVPHMLWVRKNAPPCGSMNISKKMWFSEA